VSILVNVSSARAVGGDISEAAIEIARRNSAANGVSERLHLLRSDVFDGIGDERFDLIASNPPYVPSSDMSGLQEEVRDFEPHTSLTDGRDGLSIVRRIVGSSPGFLKPGGLLLIEIGFNQARSVAEMFDRRLWLSLEFLPDLQGIPRLVRAVLK
jgi:release factor glutamine methyltransferase